MSENKNPTHADNLPRLARIEGQVRGVRRMVEEGAYCIDIITQVQAAQAALGMVGRSILEKHLHMCVQDAMQTKSDADIAVKIDELTQVMKRMCR